MSAHAQLSSYLDDQGNLVYTNNEAPVPRAMPGKSLVASASGQRGLSPQPVSAQPTATPASTPGTVTTPAPTPAALDQLVEQTAEKHNVDPELVRAVISTESNWNASAVSRKGAQGLMQLVPGTAFQLGVANAFDPAQNVDAGVRYLRMMLERYNGDLNKALAAYNAGPSAVDRFGGVPNYRETRNYVERVTSTYFRPGSDRQPSALSAAKPIYRTTAADGRVIFTNE